MMRRMGVCLLLLCIPLQAGCMQAWAENDPMHSPEIGSSRRWPLSTQTAPDYLAIVRRPAEATGTGPFLAMLNFYRIVISPVDGDRCEMAPTCSLYAQQAFKDHGVVMGFLLTADRLLHEGDEKPRVRTYRLGRDTYYVDPLSANTYWLPRWLQ